MGAPDFLLLAAFEPELAGLGNAPPNGWRMATAGIGGVAAAANTARLIAEARPHKVLFVGTCGAYTNRLDVGDCVAASEVAAISIPEIQRRAFRPQVETLRWRATWELPLPERAAIAPPAITSSAEDAALLCQLADVEHLELAGVFAACHLANVPAAAALVVANRVGPDAHAEWLANHEAMSRKLMDTLICLKVFENSQAAR